MSHEIQRDEKGKETGERPVHAHADLYYHLYRCEPCGKRDHGHEHGHQRAIHSPDSDPPEVVCPSCSKPMTHSLTHYADAGAAEDEPTNYAPEKKEEPKKKKGSKE